MAEISWPVDEPDTLEDLCLHYCLNHPESIEIFLNIEENIQLSSESLADKQNSIPDISLPRILCDKIYNYLSTNILLYACDSGVCFRKYLSLLKDYCQIHLGRFVLRDQNSDWKMWLMLASQFLKEIDICCHGYCTSTEFPRQLVSTLNKISSLKCLTLNLNALCLNCEEPFLKNLASSQIEVSFSDSDENFADDFMHNMEEDERTFSEYNVTRQGDGIGHFELLKCPNVQFLSLKNFPFRNVIDGQELLAMILKPMAHLTKLDLSGSGLDVEFMDCLESLVNLTSLLLANVIIKDVCQAFENICKAKKLRYLDISRAVAHNFHVEYVEPEKHLSYLVENLPDLKSLDLSGTNLTISKQPTEDGADVDDKRSNSPIPALHGRHFDFLGLWACPQHVCRKQNLPAKKVTGESNEEQLLFSLQMYQGNDRLLIQVLKVSAWRLKKATILNLPVFLDTILLSMEAHMRDEEIIRLCSISLYFIVEGTENKITLLQRRKILELVLPVMHMYRHDIDVIKYCMYSLLCLNLPQDAVNCYMFEHYLHVLLHIMSERSDENGFQENVGLLLLHSACRANNREKTTVIQSGFLDYLLNFLEKSLNTNRMDSRVEKAWSCIWSLTDEAPSNCEIFLSSKKGMDLYMKYIERFPLNNGLLKKMTGLLSNVAEVPWLHYHLMKEKILKFLSDKLTTIPDAIEISYHAAGILSNLALEGPDAWSASTVDRDEILERMKQEIMSWDINETRKIKYRSLSPMIKLTEVSDCPVAQYWGVWALLNLVKTKPERYCRMLTVEMGITALENILADSRVEACTKQLAMDAIDSCAQFRESDIIPEEF